jgi:hypothetical protein
LDTHLTTTYSKINANNIDNNLANMNKAWTSNQPIKDLISQLHIAQEFDEDTKPIHDPLPIAQL